MKLAERMDRILVESAFEVLVRARALEATGRSVIHLEIGEPDFPTPAHIVEAAKEALHHLDYHLCWNHGVFRDHLLLDTHLAHLEYARPKRDTL